jgi:predicted PurR-regulated permease PerM
VVSAGVPAPPEAASQEELTVQVAPYVRTGVAWLVGQAGNLGLLLLHFLLTILITAILLRDWRDNDPGRSTFRPPAGCRPRG